MRSLPLIIVVGANDLAQRVCEELSATQGHEVVLLASADDYGVLETAGARTAECIIPVGDDDRVNLRVALKARDLNPEIRIVLRQFNRALGRKIEQNLHGCVAVSPATHAAATFAAACIDPSTIQAVQFPLADGPLMSFAQRSARDFGLGATTVADAERHIECRIVALNGAVNPAANDRIQPGDTLVVCGPVTELHPRRRRSRAEQPARPARRPRLRDAFRTAVRLEPLLLYTFAVGFVLFFAASVYFSVDMHITFLEAMYFVAATMFTVGYGDITPYIRHSDWPAYVAAIFVMGAGVTIGGVFIASISSLLNRAQETALRGLRQIRAENHIVIFGAGNVGMRVIEFLLDLGQEVVVVEPRPNSRLLELARRRRVDLLASDATDDDTLAFCNLRRAHGVAAVTDSDTANVEAALGALAYNSRVPVVLRIGDVEFARSIARNFSIGLSFATSDLTAPLIAGLSRFPASRGRVTFAGEMFAIGERTADMYVPRGEGGVPLFVWRAGELLQTRNFDDLQPGDRLLDIVPLSQFRAGAKE
ncbi:MAG TPA: NAD-binding protein [Candidatus Baltobacteraceae bacterium]|nr:NAD-binding protein [Candidatus Baltobacteraceae bacterium]